MPTNPTSSGLPSGLAIDFSETSTLSTTSISGSRTRSAFNNQHSTSCTETTEENTSTQNECDLSSEPSSQTSHRGLGCKEDTSFGNRSLLTYHGTPGQTAAELKQILGNANSRLKSGAELSSGSFLEPQLSQNISLEQAKSRSRVNLDIFLHSNACVQGGYLRGYIQVRIRKHLKNHKPLLISQGNLRLIGFESLDADGERSIFYQCSEPLSDVTLGMERIYSSEPDGEGFSSAAEGIHSLPFVLYITPESETGTPKGVLPLQSGLSIRYIALVSLGIKDPLSGKKSIAHFYRDCNVWPRLNPSIILAPTSRPIQVTASESLRMGGHGQIILTASLHRLHWVSGQSCFVKFKIVNNSEKALKNVCLQLIRSTTVFRVGYKFDASKDDPKSASIADVLQSSTTKRQVSQSILEVCARGNRGHASANGWWAGVIPGQTRSFSHDISIPPDALSISRGHLIEVSYALQVAVNVGTMLPTEVRVSLPIEIVNFLSFDPPHPAMISNPAGAKMHLSESSESCVSDMGSEMESEHTERDSQLEEECDSGDEALDRLVDDADAEDTKSPPTFADLYYSSLQENLDKAAEQHEQHVSGTGIPPAEPRHANLQSTFATRVKEKYLQRQALLASNALTGDQLQLRDLNAGHEPDSGYQLESPISGVGLPDGVHNQRPYWKTPALIRSDHVSQSVPPKSLPQIPRALSEDTGRIVDRGYPSGQPNSSRPAGNPDTPIKPSSPSAPRAGSVKDKIRELEELAAKAEGDT